MIISFSLENWMSFRDRVTFSMVASRELQHGERVPKLGKYNTRILPIAAIYGGNASGKTNLVKALSFVKDLVIKVTQPDSMIPVEPFLLDATSVEKPSSFTLEILVGDDIYEFSFSVTQKAVLKEKLILITSTSEKELYDRSDGHFSFDRSLYNSSKEKQFLEFVFEGTGENQLFLTNAISRKLEIFRPVYNWFKEKLDLIYPDAIFQPFEQFMDESHPIYPIMNKMMQQLDTGISRLGGEELRPDKTLPQPLKEDLQKHLKEGITVRLVAPEDERLLITRKNGQLISKKLVSYHLKSDGTEARFKMGQESNGTQRLMDLLPAFLDLSQTQLNKVYIIDEIDRSLHTLLIRRLIESYLASCSNESRAQLLMTTHNVLLMDQKLLRRDEMWVTERDAEGVTNLLSFSEYKDIRYDKDIRKSYLQGRLGGIPRILLEGAMVDSCATDKSERQD